MIEIARYHAIQTEPLAVRAPIGFAQTGDQPRYAGVDTRDFHDIQNPPPER